MTEQEFLNALRGIVDAHISRMATTHTVLSYSTAALMKAAREAGVSGDLMRTAIDGESTRVDLEMDQVIRGIAQSLQTPSVH